MATTGNPDRWVDSFPASLVPQVIQLVLESWQNFKTSQTEEVPITQEFFVVLDRNHEFLKLPFLIDLEVTLPNADGTEQIGRLDLRFIYGFRRTIYFSIECKRLRFNFLSGFKPLANEYVMEGMYRYFNGQYAEGLDNGGMLGYVMDGNVYEAIQDITKAIENHRAELHMELNDSIRCSSCSSSQQIKETLHKYGPNNRFVVHHIFLPVS